MPRQIPDPQSSDNPKIPASHPLPPFASCFEVAALSVAVGFSCAATRACCAVMLSDTAKAPGPTPPRCSDTSGTCETEVDCKQHSTRANRIVEGDNVNTFRYFSPGTSSTLNHCAVPPADFLDLFLDESG